MDTGQRVKVIEYGGRKLIRRVVADRGSTIVICNEQEFSAAIKENRPPQGVGFLREFVELLKSEE